MNGWFIGPLMPAVALLSTVMYVRALLPSGSWHREQHFLILYAIFVSPLTGLLCSFLFFDRSSKYVDAGGMLITTGISVVVTAALLITAYFVCGYRVVVSLFYPLATIPERPPARMLIASITGIAICLVGVLVPILNASHFPVLEPSLGRRWIAGQDLWGDKTQVQNAVMVIVFITSLPACFLVVFVRALVEQLLKKYRQ